MKSASKKFVVLILFFLRILFNQIIVLAPNIPYGFHAQIIHGFVEELVVNDDPEYQWIDKIRTPRASNEARQTVFLKLSGQVRAPQATSVHTDLISINY